MSVVCGQLVLVERAYLEEGYRVVFGQREFPDGQQELLGELEKPTALDDVASACRNSFDHATSSCHLGSFLESSEKHNSGPYLDSLYVCTTVFVQVCC